MKRCDFTIPTLTSRSANGMQQGLNSKSKEKQFHLNGLPGVLPTCCRHRNYTQNSLALNSFTTIFFFSSEDSHHLDSPLRKLVSLWPSSDSFKRKHMPGNSQVEVNDIFGRNILLLRQNVCRENKIIEEAPIL